MGELIPAGYRADDENRLIELGAAGVEVTCDGQSIRGNGRASIRLRPHLRLSVTVDFAEDCGSWVSMGMTKDAIQLKYGAGVLCTAFLSRARGLLSEDGGSEIEFVPTPQKMAMCAHPRPRLDAAIFHIMNFRAFHCGSRHPHVLFESGCGAVQSLGRVFLEQDGWQIEIQEVPDARRVIETLNADGGSGITHVGKIRRRSGKTFTISAMRRTMRELHLFFSFARGLWTPVMLPVGFDSQGGRVFEEWGVTLGESWESCTTWFDDHHGEALADLYPGFVALLRDRAMGAAVPEALYWYLKSNRAGRGAGPDGGLILSQAALERLAFAYLAKHSLSINGKAGEVLASACAHMGLSRSIPIPKSLKALHNANRRLKGKWRHGLHALVDIRNDMVHPQNRLNRHRNELIFEAWKLAQWYISLIILRLSGYNGQYSNHLTAQWCGEVEDVPWQKCGENHSQKTHDGGRIRKPTVTLLLNR